jgi:hypothetical protein
VLYRPQKREQDGAEWAPKFFVASPSMEILPGEETPEAVPLWAWNGKYTETKQQAPAAEAQEWEGGCYTGWSAHTLLTITSTWQQHYGNTTATQFPTSKQPVTVPL